MPPAYPDPRAPAGSSLSCPCRQIRIIPAQWESSVSGGTLAEHNIVLLLGNPATGKSTIAAILATTATEDPNHRCFKADGPEELLDNWNPNEPGGFYWIDDAFGPNQVREDFIDHWIQLMPKIQAAIAGGNQFVLASRRHIYEAAKAKLGTRNHPSFRDESAIVDVGSLTVEERRQILYNHIKASSQTNIWKRNVKPHLEVLAREQTFLPEIARRLGDPAYTKGLRVSRDNLVRFVREPKEHLLQTIRELSQSHRAALTLVFLHRDRMPFGEPEPFIKELVQKYFSIDADSLGQAVQQLRDSFLVEKIENESRIWSFKHPTLSDAVGAILSEIDGMTELYLRGTNSRTILASVQCGGVAPIRDAILVPDALTELLVNRLGDVPDEPDSNRQLFAFLSKRASDKVFQSFVEQNPSVLSRKTGISWRLGYDAKVNAHARAFALGVMPESIRQATASRLEKLLFEELDTSFLDDDEILALLNPSLLLRLMSRIRDELLKKIPDMAIDLVDDADLEIEPEDNFADLTSALDCFEMLFDKDEEAQHLVMVGSEAVNDAIEDVKTNQEESQMESDHEDWRWEQYTPGTVRQSSEAASKISTSLRSANQPMARSIFSDVDK